MTRKVFAKFTAITILVTMALGALFGLWEVRGSSQTVWPFPKSARLLPGMVEIILWMAVGIALLIGLWILLATLFEMAGWYHPNKATERCWRCHGTGEVSRR
jgi:hypothetical protein